MHRSMRFPSGALAAVFAAVLLAAGGAPAGQRGSGAAAPASTVRRAECTFSNPGYAGKCVEVTEIGEDSSAADACGAILACLNNPTCASSYCQATTIREGWKLDKAEELH